MITIGSDPEFVILDVKKNEPIESYQIFKNKVYSAKSVAPVCLTKNSVLCYEDYNKSRGKMCTEKNHFCGHLVHSPEIGCDGSLGELRPQPGETPIAHVENIRELILEVASVLKAHEEVRAGTLYRTSSSGGWSLGGHIHIGMDSLKDDSRRRDFSQYVSYYSGLILRCIENIDDARYRGLRKDNFGYYGKYDTKPYGIEWRMPASWLISKEIATAELCLTYVVADDYNQPSKTRIGEVSHATSLADYEYQEIVENRNVQNIIEDVEQMKLYGSYKKEIEPLFQMINNKQTWDQSVNVLNNW